MNLFYILFGIVSIQCSNLSEIVNTELREFVEKREKIEFQAQSQSNIRQSSETAKLLNEIFNLVSGVLKLKGRSDNGSVKINSELCLLSCLNITCNESDYQSFDGSCNNINNPFYGRTNTPFRRYLSPSYDIANEFTTAAMRMGHSLIRDQFTRLYVSQEVIEGRDFSLDEITFKSDYAHE